MMLKQLCLVIAVAIFTLPVLAEDAECRDWPTGMVFVGLTDSSWQLYAVLAANARPVSLDVDSEARTPVLSVKDNQVFFVDEAGFVQSLTLSDRKITTLLKPSSEASFTQLEYDQENQALYVVQLKQGKSVDTDILRFDLKTNKTQPVVVQRSAQFEPHLSGDWLYYSNVHCVLGCGKIIQELWRYNLVSGLAEQITLLGEIARQPVVDRHNNAIYFSSNAAGNFHLYRQALSDPPASPERITQGAVTDMSPVIVNQTLYFIRHDANGVRLMCQHGNNPAIAMIQPTKLKDIRDLEIY